MASLGEREMKSEGCFCWVCLLSDVWKQMPKIEQDQRLNKNHSSKLELHAVYIKNYVPYPYLGKSAQVETVFVPANWCK